MICLTKFCIVYGTWKTTANFTYFHLELNAVVVYLALVCMHVFLYSVNAVVVVAVILLVLVLLYFSSPSS